MQAHNGNQCLVELKILVHVFLTNALSVYDV